MGLSQRQIFTVILFAIGLGASLTVVLFMMSRNDPSLRVGALISASNNAIALIAIASTMATGKDLTKRDPEDLPPGSVQKTTETLAVPPVSPQNASNAE